MLENTMADGMVFMTGHSRGSTFDDAWRLPNTLFTLLGQCLVDRWKEDGSVWEENTELQEDSRQRWKGDSYHESCIGYERCLWIACQIMMPYIYNTWKTSMQKHGYVQKCFEYCYFNCCKLKKHNFGVITFFHKMYTFTVTYWAFQ